MAVQEADTIEPPSEELPAAAPLPPPLKREPTREEIVQRVRSEWRGFTETEWDTIVSQDLVLRFWNEPKMTAQFREFCITLADQYGGDRHALSHAKRLEAEVIARLGPPST
jgi:hypothetical protein